MASDFPVSVVSDNTAKGESDALGPAGDAPSESFQPGRDWKAGGDLLGTTSAAKEHDEDAMPSIVLDESKDLLVISDSKSLRDFLAGGGKAGDSETRRRTEPAAGELWTNEVPDAELDKPDLDSEVLARAAEWIEW